MPGWPPIPSIITWRTFPRGASIAIQVPGRGAIDFPAVLREIDKSGYADWITVELYPYIEDPDQAGREAKRYIAQTRAASV